MLLSFNTSLNCFFAPLKFPLFSFTNPNASIRYILPGYILRAFSSTCRDSLFLPIAINELAFNIINKTKNSNDAYYWFEWILSFETLAKKNKNSISCSRREFNVLSKHQYDIIWVVWDVILNESYKRNQGIQKIINSLLELYCIRYSPGSKRKRKFIIYFAISLLTEIVDNNIPIFNDSEPINAVKNKIDNIYKQIKSNEIKPNTDYLFTGLNSGNLEKTIEKLDKMSRLNNIIRSNN